MKIVSWNIRHGGGTSTRATLIRRRLIEYNADILVIPEFQIGNSGNALCDALGHAGYEISYPPAKPSANTVIIASRHSIVAAPAFENCLLDPRHLWSIKTAGIRLVGVYMPVGAPKLPYWEALIRNAGSADAPNLFVGDFNTGTNRLDKDPRGEPFVGPEYMDRITSAGFVDLWRVRHPEEREYTWFSARGKNGFRLDHAFGSALFHRALISCDYDHEPRLVGESDHSALVLQLGIFQHEPLAPIIGCIYAVADPEYPNLVKIGKDQKWPMRLRQAQAHTPRGMNEVGHWNIRGDRAKLASMERQALSLFPREQSCPGREWVQVSSLAEARERLSILLGEPEPPTEVRSLRPFDDWRDYARPPHSHFPRRIWIGQENGTGRLKIVHSPHTDKFGDACPTYSRHGISWIEAWAWPAGVWSASLVLNDLDRQLVQLWTELVNDFGFGPDDPRLGWLRDGITADAVRSRLESEGLVQNAI